MRCLFFQGTKFTCTKRILLVTILKSTLMMGGACWWILHWLLVHDNCAQWTVHRMHYKSYSVAVHLQICVYCCNARPYCQRASTLMKSVSLVICSLMVVINRLLSTIAVTSRSIYFNLNGWFFSSISFSVALTKASVDISSFRFERSNNKFAKSGIHRATTGTACFVALYWVI